MIGFTFEIALRVDAAAPAAEQQRINYRTSPPGLWMTPGEKEGAAIKDVLRTYNPSKRLAEPLEIAKLAAYLASDDSAYVVGADFAIDGGAGAFSQLRG